MKGALCHLTSASLRANQVRGKKISKKFNLMIKKEQNNLGESKYCVFLTSRFCALVF